MLICHLQVGKQPEVTPMPCKKKAKTMVDIVEFDVEQAVKNLGVVPAIKKAYRNYYSWGYHKHEALFKSQLSRDSLKQQCRLVWQRVAAMLES